MGSMESLHPLDRPSMEISGELAGGGEIGVPTSEPSSLRLLSISPVLISGVATLPERSGSSDASLSAPNPWNFGVLLLYVREINETARI